MIAIFDVGKTHKKVFLFDEHYSIQYEHATELPETVDEDGYPCEDLRALTNWFHQALTSLFQKKEFEIMAVNTTAYGASFVHLDTNDQPLTPLYNYLKPYPDVLLHQFYEKYGNASAFNKITASPPSGNLNSGLQLYRLKYERPELFDRLKFSLHLPHYLSFLLSHRHQSNVTSVGCHTCLWDFAHRRYHAWVEREGFLHKLAPNISSSEISIVNFGGKPIAVGTGLHDSSSALIPYLEQFTKPFVLLSTGTWNIALNPFNATSLTDQELQKDCLCYLSYLGKPVKAARLFAGFVHQQHVGKIASHFHRAQEFYQDIPYNKDLVKKSDKLFAEPKDLPTGKFHFSDPGHFISAEEAYHDLVARIMDIQIDSLSLILQPQTKHLFVDGGFSQNKVFMGMLKNAFPSITVSSSFVPQASAIGAAMAIHPHWNQRSIPGDIVRLR